MREFLCGNRTVLNLDYNGNYMNVQCVKTSLNNTHTNVCKIWQNLE